MQFESPYVLTLFFRIYSGYLIYVMLVKFLRESVFSKSSLCEKQPFEIDLMNEVTVGSYKLYLYVIYIW